MEKDDSNSASFEIIDKKALDQINNGENKSDTLSSISSPYSVTSPGSLVSLSTGNLLSLSTLGPPSSIPDFTLYTPSAVIEDETSSPPQSTKTAAITTAPIMMANQFPTTQFSAAIPPSKGIPQPAAASHQSNNKPSIPLEAEAVPSSSFMGLVKGALSSQVVTKMVEKAKSSVDSIITTLDPQMSEYIYSGGDVEITVASDEEDLVSGIREAAHSVFGKAWINGIKLSTTIQKSQAVGIDSGLLIAEERIEYSYKFRKTPTIAIENVLLKEGNNWFDVSLLVLKDLDLGISLHTFSQAIPVPVEKFLDKEVADIDIELKLSEYLKGVPCWQEEVSGLARKDIVAFAAKVLFKLYKDRLIIIKPKT